MDAELGHLFWRYGVQMVHRGNYIGCWRLALRTIEADIACFSQNKLFEEMYIHGKLIY